MGLRYEDMTPAQRANHNARGKRRRDARRAAGQCVGCGGEPGEFIFCAACRTRFGKRCDHSVSRNGIPLGMYSVDSDKPYDYDTDCQELVALHPEGMLLDEIAHVMTSKAVGGGKLSRERIRQIEEGAERKLRRLRDTDPDLVDDLLALMASRRQRQTMWERMAGAA